MASKAASPSNAAPYPTDVGTATTGALINPATTLGSAPSMPATTTTTAARRSNSRRSRIRCSPATPTSTTVSVASTEIGGGQGCFAGDRQVGGAGGGDDHQPAGWSGRGGRPGQQSRRLVVVGIGQLVQDRRRVVRRGAGEQGDVGRGPQRAGYRGHLGRRLSLAVDRLRVSTSGAAVAVQVGERRKGLLVQPGPRSSVLDQGQREGTRLQAGRVDADESEAGAQHRFPNCGAERLQRGARQVGGGQFHATQLTVVTHP